MSYLEYRVKTVPTGWRKILFINWGLVALIIGAAFSGFVMLISVAGGSLDPWASAQMQRFSIGLIAMFAIAMTPIWVWRNVSIPIYILALLLLLLVEFLGNTGMGAQRWINLGFINLQPSEVAKIALVMLMAAYYDWLPIDKVSKPFWVLVPLIFISLPVLLTIQQPDLGTAILLLLSGVTVMFLAGVHWIYFGTVLALSGGLVLALFKSRGTEWQLLQEYQFLRIDTFLNPDSDPLGAGYHITQSKIALGSGGWTGRGFMEGTQSRLNFLPEKHTDFIFTTIAEELGFIGTISILAIYVGITIFCLHSALRHKERFSSLLSLGLTVTFFLFFAVNMSMVMGLAPVVGVPLPLISYGGSAMIVLLGAFGLIQSAHIHRPRGNV
jgi:rod shape determining protein RodA